MDEQNMNDNSPLQQGKSFSSYRDINRAIEKHREIFGLRLALKRAIKLENYHLTVDQLKDLNLRLKYGELDYHCFAATGRPGRPGNGERCPQIVRLKLSADAQSLVVYKSHTHGIFPPHEVVSKPAAPPTKQNDIIALSSDHPTCLRDDITLTPINPVSKDSALTLTKLSQPQDPTTTSSNIPYQPGNFILDNNNAFTSIIPFSQTSSFSPPSPESEVNSITITPTPPFSLLAQNNLQIKEVGGSSPSNERNEKLTMKIKKSTVDPNEMVVVRGVQEKAEQQKAKRNEEPANLKNSESPKTTTPETNSTTLREITVTSRGSSTPKPPSSTANSPKPGGITPKMVNSITNKISTTQSGPAVVRRATPEATGGGKPSTVSKTNSGTLQKVSPGPTSSSTKSPLGVTQKPLNVTPKQGISPKTTTPTTPTKPTVLKLSSNMKQIIIKKPSHMAAGKPTMAKTAPAVKPLGDKNSNLPDQVKKLAPKSVTNAKVSKLGSTNTGTPTQGASEGTIKNGDKIRFKKAEKQVTKNCNTHVGAKSQAPGDKQVTKSANNPGVMKQTQGNSAPAGNSGSAPVGGRLPSNPKRLLKKKPGRPPDSSNYIPLSLDTELGSGEKQNLANRVLSQLLRVTSQLPMVEFSHALDTLEILTDAFRLGQRVTLSIRHKQEELFHDESYSENLVESRMKSEAKELASPARNSPFPNLQRALLPSQVDGQLDSEQFLKGLRSFSSLLPAVEPLAEVMDIESPKIINTGSHLSEVESRVLDSPSSSLRINSSCPSNSKRGIKRHTGNTGVGVVGVKRTKF